MIGIFTQRVWGRNINVIFPITQFVLGSSGTHRPSFLTISVEQLYRFDLSRGLQPNFLFFAEENVFGQCCVELSL